MQTTLHEMTCETIADFRAIDRSFRYDCRLIPSFCEGRWNWSFEKCDACEKDYPFDEQDEKAALESLERDDMQVFLAYADGALAGDVHVGLWWNGCAYIYDIAVMPAFRGQGIAQALMRRAQA